MRNWRVLTAAASVVLAVLAGVVAYRYVRGADDRARSDEELVRVMQAASDIPEGTRGAVALADGLIRAVDVPRKLVPPAALQEADGIGRRVTPAPVAEGQFLTTGSFVDAETAVVTGGLSAELERGRYAMQIQLDQTHAVGGFVVPGDRVNVIVTVDGPTGGAETAYLLDGLKVLAVGAMTADEAVAEARDEVHDGNQGLLTVEVTARQALQLAHAQSGGAGSVYLTLAPADFEPESFTPPDRVAGTSNLFDPASARSSSGGASR